MLKNEAVNKKHLTKNFDVARFCRQNCWIYMYIMWTSTEYIFLQTVP